MEDNNTIWKDLDIDSLQNKTDKHATIPYFVHEGEMARMERVNRRLWILCLVIFLALVGTNAGWIYYESQFEDVSTTVTQDVDSGIFGGNATINDGVHINGENTANSND